ncbi:hypothetical protein ACFOY4_18525 [Actinomadura syzygii]|uniref:Uncharacterized protein n=1 Tax=Actinomadura syzygii TaxID=1427538 RepID=A0A5D0U0U1_9ACTN|nr:hypothetical protein [Actinomadura syzygii]TYC12191.1 hypothetical protein FXF65_23200 [Actinomadura syzygii]
MRATFAPDAPSRTSTSASWSRDTSYGQPSLIGRPSRVTFSRTYRAVRAGNATVADRGRGSPDHAGWPTQRAVQSAAASRPISKWDGSLHADARPCPSHTLTCQDARSRDRSAPPA